MTTTLTRRRIEQILRAAREHLQGDWVLLGGALAALWLRRSRVTEDIDLVGFAGTAAERLQLLELAEALKIPIEAVNTAADFFLRRIPDWRNQLVPFRKGRHCRIYRPSATLFLLLKMERLSEQDLADCLALVRKKRRDRSIPLDRGRLLERMIELSEEFAHSRLERLNTLRDALAALGPYRRRRYLVRERIT